MEAFDTLGDTLWSRWRAEQYREDCFATLACEALREFPPFDHGDIVRWVMGAHRMPRQHDPEANFGQPPVTLYHCPQFYIDLYYWLDGTTSIHQHSFTGGFKVVAGSSLHSTFAYTVDKEINARCRLGRLTGVNCELLSVGDVRPILAGGQLIHSLFHLDRPSVSLVIRTPEAPYAKPQWDYQRSGLAVDPFYKNAVLRRQLQMLPVLSAMGSEGDGIMVDFIRQADFLSAWGLLQGAWRGLCRSDPKTGELRFRKLLIHARHRHAPLGDILEPTFEEIFRQSDIVRRRKHIRQVPHRLFLGLVLNLPDWGEVLDMVGKCFPDDPAIDTVMKWITELTSQGDSAEPSALGIPGDAKTLAVLRSLLSGARADLAGAPALKHSWVFRNLIRDPFQSAGDEATAIGRHQQERA